MRVHAICPDGVDTPMLASMAGGSAPELVRSGGRILTVEEVAVAAVGPGRQPAGGADGAGWRAAVMRGGMLMPSQAGPAMRRSPPRGAAGRADDTPFEQMFVGCLILFEQVLYSRTHVRSNV